MTSLQETAKAVIVEALADFYTPEEVDQWLNLPHPQLGGRTPSSVIAAGGKGEVMAIINRLNDCAYL